MIRSRAFHHHLWYWFRFHEGKLHLSSCGFKPVLFDFFHSILRGEIPKNFHIPPRASHMREPRIFSRRVRHPLSEVAEVAKRYYLSYKNPHERVENFLLRNEKRTIAIEVPVWFLTDESFSGLTGHIDILRLTDRIEIWDYKPQADRKKFASSQLFWYAQMLARRLELEIENFRCFYFDEKKTYFFEF